jgi:hypothetical protein
MGLITEEYRGVIVGGAAPEPFGTQTAYTFRVPAGVTLLIIVAQGTGGNGGSAQGAGARGGGGSGACYVMKELAVTPGQTLTLNVPNRSALDSDGLDAAVLDGLTILVLARGGKKGGNGTTGSPSGTAGIADSSGCVGDIIFKGGDGSAGLGSTRAGAGGSGASNNGEGVDAVGITGGARVDQYGGPGGQGSTSSTGANGLNASVLFDNRGGGGGGARAADGTLRNGGRGSSGFIFITYDAPNTPSGGPQADEASCDSFSGADDADIEGREFDGCGGTGGGIWRRDDDYNNTGDNLTIIDATMGSNDDEEVLYVTEGTACPAGVGPTNFQGCRALVEFPNHDSVSVPEQCILIWEDDFSGPSQALEGRSHNGGSAGTGTYQRIDNMTNGTSDPAGAQIRDGYAYLPDQSKFAGYQIGGLVPPESFDMVLDIERATEEAPGSIGCTVHGYDTYPALPDQQGRSNQGLCRGVHDSDGDPSNNWASWRGWTNNSVFGSLFTGAGAEGSVNDHGINVGEIKSTRFRVRGVNPTYWAYLNPLGSADDSPCAAGWIQVTGVQNGQFGSPLLNLTGERVGIRFNAIPGGPEGIESGLRVKRFRIYEYVPPTTGVVFTDAWLMLTLNHIEGVQQYQATFEGVRVDADTFETYVKIFAFIPSGPDAGFWTLRGGSTPISTVNFIQGQDHVCEFTRENDPVTGNPTLYARIDGVLVKRFDLVADSPQNSGAPIVDGVLTGGECGGGMYDANHFTPLFNRAIIVKRYATLCPAAEEPCEGPPDNPYPWEPPPFPGSMPAIVGWRNGAFRTFMEGWEWRAGSFHKFLDPAFVDPLWFWGRGQMREINMLFSGQLPPPDTDLPPFYDPCNLLPEIPPGGPLDPLTSRFFGMASTPLSAMGPLLTGTQRAHGFWVVSDLAQAAAKGVTVVGGFGGVKQFLVNGRFDRDFLVEKTIENLTPYVSVLQDYSASGEYFGYSFIDDFGSPRLWPPYGVSDADIAYMVAALKSVFTGFRIGIRGMPSQFPSHIGVDFYTAQLDSVYAHGDPFSFAVREYGLSRARNTYICMDLNYVHGGDGSSGVRYANGTGIGQSAHNWMCSPTETLSYLTDLFMGCLSVDGTAEYLAGTKGYMYLPEYLSIPGMTNALAAARNVLAGLPPLP